MKEVGRNFTLAAGRKALPYRAIYENAYSLINWTAQSKTLRRHPRTQKRTEPTAFRAAASFCCAKLQACLRNWIMATRRLPKLIHPNE
jgi:hypothetical protein